MDPVLNSFFRNFFNFFFELRNRSLESLKNVPNLMNVFSSPFFFSFYGLFLSPIKESTIGENEKNVRRERERGERNGCEKWMNRWLCDWKKEKSRTPLSLSLILFLILPLMVREERKVASSRRASFQSFGEGETFSLLFSYFLSLSLRGFGGGKWKNWFLT